MDITSAINTLLAICGGISIIGGAAAVIWKWLRPAVKMKDRVDQLERNVEKDYRNIEEIKKMQASMSRILIDIMDHQIYGNHTEKMEQDKRELLSLISES